MRKINRNLFSSIFSIIILTIFIIYLFIIFNQMMSIEPTIEESPITNIIVYDTPSSDWNTVPREELEPKYIQRDLDGHFTDPQTFGCFFIVSDMLGYPIDIDDFYKQTLDQEDYNASSYEGKIPPETLFNYSIEYIENNGFDYYGENISYNGYDYLCAAASNNYPIITWINGYDWIEATPYVIYKMDKNNVYMINPSSKLVISKSLFETKWNEMPENYALIYGKHWQ